MTVLTRTKLPLRTSLFLTAATLTGLWGCADADRELGPTEVSPSLVAPEPSSAPLVQHLVAPATTDPRITVFLDEHYVWLDTASSSVHRLLVFMPGTGQRPRGFQLIEQAAARLGYHVIGLSFVNSGGLAGFCPLAPDPPACYEQTRLEIIDGVDRSPFISVDAVNSIDNRLTKLLQYLSAQYPDEGWSQFLVDDGPKWPLIAVGGLSVGGGEAAMIGKIRLVSRVVLFSAVTDSLGPESVPWLGTPGITPVNRYYGLAHDRDAFFPPIRAGWDSLGLVAFGPAMFVESSEPPYGWTHMLVTDLTPQGGQGGQNPVHISTANDNFTPLAADGTPALLEAWRYLLGGLPRRPGAAFTEGAGAEVRRGR